MHIYPAICDLINQDLRHGKPETHPSPESRSRAIDGKEVSSGLKPAASPAATSPPSTFGFRARMRHRNSPCGRRTRNLALVLEDKPLD